MRSYRQSSVAGLVIVLIARKDSKQLQDARQWINVSSGDDGEQERTSRSKKRSQSILQRKQALGQNAKNSKEISPWRLQSHLLCSRRRHSAAPILKRWAGGSARVRVAIGAYVRGMIRSLGVPPWPSERLQQYKCTNTLISDAWIPIRMYEERGGARHADEGWEGKESSAM